MGGGRVQREIVPNSLYSLLFYFELFPKLKSCQMKDKKDTGDTEHEG